MVRTISALAAAVVSSLAMPATAQYIHDIRAAVANAEALTTRVTIQTDDTTLEELFAAIEQLTGADLEPLWEQDAAVGLVRDARVSVNAENRAAFTIIERVLQNTSQGFDENNWQFTPDGALEMGPESRLIRRRYLAVYEVADLIYDAPDFTDAPEVDVEAGGGGAGGGGNIFGGGGGGGGDDADFDEEEIQQERLDDLVDLIQSSIEPEHWFESGGRATIRVWKRQLLIRAAPFIHRKISGSEVLTHRRLSDRAYRWANSYERGRSLEFAVIDQGRPDTAAPPPQTPAAPPHRADRGDGADGADESSDE